MRRCQLAEGHIHRADGQDPCNLQAGEGPGTMGERVPVWCGGEWANAYPVIALRLGEGRTYLLTKDPPSVRRGRMWPKRTVRPHITIHILMSSKRGTGTSPNRAPQRTSIRTVVVIV